MQKNELKTCVSTAEVASSLGGVIIFPSHIADHAVLDANKAGRSDK